MLLVSQSMWPLCCSYSCPPPNPPTFYTPGRLLSQPPQLPLLCAVSRLTLQWMSAGVFLSYQQSATEDVSDDRLLQTFSPHQQTLYQFCYWTPITQLRENKTLCDSPFISASLFIANTHHISGDTFYLHLPLLYLMGHQQKHTIPLNHTWYLKKLNIFFIYLSTWKILRYCRVLPKSSP